ncbi:putative toxin-antitoxin system toxin component, PIN family [Sphaerospermopsis torques-reginae]|uniref:Toxin-antitoxin system toxin component, PIN family n=1 Tax=Sphaerospermopsis torques-reginae ITEP-024 TaxID=984208 RepID=A0ABX8X4K2_9CYAN|nr:putative toxin-antitoxin system toxin component, PIN family [Sphaerospermopsis torques-reginae]QYX33645.1 putative toxin-antitoxin system toxin component, PIN family [Sphaerospermopsis torques-reginae ITEP-024]
MKVIIDTNVLVSAVLKGREPRDVIQFVVDSPHCDWIVSEDILAEYQDVLSRKKFKLTDEVRKEWLEIINLVTTLVDVQVTVDFARDRKDEKFLACAVAAEADFLITGDSDFNQAQNLVNTTIVSVSTFKQLIGDFRG